MTSDAHRARAALLAIPPDLPREEWHRIGRAAIAAGLDVDALVEWSRTAPNFKNEKDVRSAFRNITPDGGTGPGTLFQVARDNGWHEANQNQPERVAAKPPKTKPTAAETKRKTAPGMGPSEVWSRCIVATDSHPYVQKKDAIGAPLDGLRVVPEGDPLRILGESMVGALVLPVTRPDGTLSSLQFITPPETAERLKANGHNDKPNLPGASMDGWLTVGTLTPGATAYICEGIGTAWACWKATGAAAVVCFGWGRVKTVAEALRQQDAEANLVLVPDVGKEAKAAEIAGELGCQFVTMPEGWPNNADVCDFAQREGFDALEVLLSAPKAPAKRYKLLSGADLAELPPLRWRVRGVLPAEGVAALYGPSASGKSFLALDMAAAIAEGRRWFDCRVTAAPVVYAALEGEAGFRARVLAWEAHNQRKLPENLRLMLQPFALTNAGDVSDFGDVIPRGAVVLLDTLNRAAPTADENSSTDMGAILEATKRLQAMTGGLVCLVHHTGKDTTKGLRGHSSLFAALDAAVEVSRDGDRREWKVAKSKDGRDGDAHPFRLKIQTLGIDEHDDEITSCVVVPDLAASEVERVKLPQGGNQRLVLEALRPLFKAGATGKPGAPPLRPCIELEAAVNAGAGKLTCPTDRRSTRAREAIKGLASRGVIGLNEGWLWLV